jgi:hypothetical protein
MPVVDDPKGYGDRWNSWWWGMQPSWRDPDIPFDLPSEVPAGSWSNMLCGGPNGVLLVVLALAWWLKSSTETNSSAIKEAALDVTWVLGQLRLALDVDTEVVDAEIVDDNRPPKRYLIHNTSNCKQKLMKFRFRKH